MAILHNQSPTKITSDLLSGVCRHSNKHTLENTRKCNVRSKIWWFTKICNSHYVSHFAAFFIVVRAKTSVAESRKTFTYNVKGRLVALAVRLVINLRTFFSSGLILFIGVVLWLRFPRGNQKVELLLHDFTVIWSWKICSSGSRRETRPKNHIIISNDPSAGSPTETLLRLHLPLNDKVWTSFLRRSE